MTASAPLRTLLHVNGDSSTQGEGAWLATPEQVSVWVGLDVGKESHFADVLDNDGERLFARGISNDQGDIEALLDRAGKRGVPGLVIGQPGSIAQLVLAVAARRGTPVAYVPGLVMRRAADLYPGEAKTDRRDAFILADTARTRRRQVHWLDASSDELLAQLRVLNGFNTDLGRRPDPGDQPAARRADQHQPRPRAGARGPARSTPGVRNLVAACPALTALRAPGRTRSGRRSPAGRRGWRPRRPRPSRRPGRAGRDRPGRGGDRPGHR